MTTHQDPNGYDGTHEALAIEALSDQVLAELFGTAQVTTEPDSPDLARHQPALFAELRELYEQCHPITHDYSALAPGPTVNRCLGRLVAIVRGEYWPNAPAYSDGIRRKVTYRLLERIRNQPDLLRKARLMRRISAVAETEMEWHYSEQLLQRLRACSTHTLASVRTPLEHVLAGFPYVQSYRELVAAELELLRRPIVPLFVRDRLRARWCAGAQEGLQRLQHEFIDQVRRRHVQPALRAASSGDEVIAMCGCGPLPLSGLMLHMKSGVRVVLVDIDPRAVARARSLVEELERLQVLRAGAITLRSGDVAALDFCAGKAAPCNTDSIGCVAIIVASLVPREAKFLLARRLRDMEDTASIALVLRSSASLCSQLAYEPVDTHRISDLRLPFCGEALPENLVDTSLDAHAAAAQGVTSLATGELVHVSHPDVLNSSELYQRVPLQFPLSSLDFSRYPQDPRLQTDLESAIHWLQAGA